MFQNKRIVVLALLPLFVISCSKDSGLTNQELLHKAYLDVIEATQEKIRPLVTLTKTDENITWNQGQDKVLLFTFHRYPSSYPENEEVTFTWGESWLCSVKEYVNWYKENKNNIKDILLRTKQVLGMDEASQNTYITSMWFDPNDVSRPAYVTDPTKQMALQFEENATDKYKEWFQSQYYYSYETKHLPWTRLGYTYDWSKEAKDRYGLTEFIAWKGTTVTVEKTLLVNEFIEYYAK